MAINGSMEALLLGNDLGIKPKLNNARLVTPESVEPGLYGYVIVALVTNTYWCAYRTLPGSSDEFKKRVAEIDKDSATLVNQMPGAVADVYFAASDGDKLDFVTAATLFPALAWSGRWYNGPFENEVRVFRVKKLQRLYKGKAYKTNDMFDGTERGE